MRLKKDISEQKLRGAYYTPLQLANAMVSLVAAIAKMVLDLRDTDQLCIKGDDELLSRDPQIICSMGLVNPNA